MPVLTMVKAGFLLFYEIMYKYMNISQLFDIIWLVLEKVVYVWPTRWIFAQKVFDF